MKNIITIAILATVLVACKSNHVSFDGIKVFDGRFNVALETNEKEKINKLETLFNDRVEFNEIAPTFKYLIEFNTPGGTERWKYSQQGYTQKYNPEDQRIFALLNKEQFNELAHIN